MEHVDVGQIKSHLMKTKQEKAIVVVDSSFREDDASGRFKDSKNRGLFTAKDIVTSTGIERVVDRPLDTSQDMKDLKDLQSR